MMVPCSMVPSRMDERVATRDLHLLGELDASRAPGKVPCRSAEEMALDQVQTSTLVCSFASPIREDSHSWGKLEGLGPW